MRRILAMRLGCKAIATGLLVLTAIALMPAAASAQVRGYRGGQMYTPQPYTLADSQPGMAVATEPAVNTPPPAPPAGQPAANPAPNYFAEECEQAACPSPTFTPNMIGDLGGGSNYIWQTPFVPSTLPPPTLGAIPLNGGNRNFKISDNENPVPQDRIFYDYNHFQKAVKGGNLTDPSPWNNIEWHNFGVEKTFLNGAVSLELRIPFTSGVASTQDATDLNVALATQIGNIPLVFKGLLIERETWALSSGLGIVLPSAPDAAINLGGTDFLRFDNRAVHVQPFLGLAWTPNDKFFAQLFMQIDFDANGNPVQAADLFTGNLTRIGVLQDQALMYVDFKVGRWVYKNPGGRFITGIAPTLELHYTTSLQDADVVNDPNTFLSFGNPYNRIDMLNLTAGIHVEMGACTDVTLFAAAPLRGSRLEQDPFLGTDKIDRTSDAMFGVQVNRRF